MVDSHRGDIFWVSLDPAVGTEIRKKRPAIVVSNDAANRKYGQVTVVPLTSQGVKQVEPFQVFVPSAESGLSKDSKALGEQIRTVSKNRLVHRAGHVGSGIMRRLETALKIHLDIE